VDAFPIRGDLCQLRPSDRRAAAVPFLIVTSRAILSAVQFLPAATLATAYDLVREVISGAGDRQNAPKLLAKVRLSLSIFSVRDDHGMSSREVDNPAQKT